MSQPPIPVCLAFLFIAAVSVSAYQDYDDVDRQPIYNGMDHQPDDDGIYHQPDYNNGGYQPEYNNGMYSPDVYNHESISCFQCNSKEDLACKNIQPNDTSNYYYKPCLDTELYKEHQPFCRKIVQKIYERDNMEIVIRKCGWIRHPRLECYTVKNDDHEEVICQCFTQGCNGSTVFLPSLAVVVLALLACFTLGNK